MKKFLWVRLFTITCCLLVIMPIIPTSHILHKSPEKIIKNLYNGQYEATFFATTALAADDTTTKRVDAGLADGYLRNSVLLNGFSDMYIERDPFWAWMYVSFNVGNTINGMTITTEKAAYYQTNSANMGGDDHVDVAVYDSELQFGVHSSFDTYSEIANAAYTYHGSSDITVFTNGWRYTNDFSSASGFGSDKCTDNSGSCYVTYYWDPAAFEDGDWIEVGTYEGEYSLRAQLLITYNTPPTANASNITGEPTRMVAGRDYTLTSKHSDVNGYADLQYAYLQMSVGGSGDADRYRFRWVQSSDIFSEVQGASFGVLDTSGSSSSCSSNDCTITWNFRPNQTWKETASLDYGVRSTDDLSQSSGWDFNDENTDFIEFRPQIDAVFLIMMAEWYYQFKERYGGIKP